MFDFEHNVKDLTVPQETYIKLKTEYHELMGQNETLKSQLAEADKRIKDYQKTLENIEPPETALPLTYFENVTNEDLKAKYDRLIQENAQLVAKNNKNIAEITKLQKLQVENEELTADNSSLHSQLEDLRGKYDEAIETNNDYLIRIRAFEDRHSKDCIKINQLNVTIDTLVDKHSKLRKIHGLV